MSPEPFPVDDLLAVARAARAHPQFDTADTRRHTPAAIAAEAEAAAEAIGRRDWRAASNIGFGLAGALDDAAHLLGVDLDPTARVASHLRLLDTLDRSEARRLWGQLAEPVDVDASEEGVMVYLADGSRVDAAFASDHDTVNMLVLWIWEHHGAKGLLDALASLRVRPGDDGTSQGRVEPLSG